MGKNTSQLYVGKQRANYFVQYMIFEWEIVLSPISQVRKKSGPEILQIYLSN